MTSSSTVAPQASPSFAAPAPAEGIDQLPDDTQQDSHIDFLCHEWAAWCKTRRFYAPAPVSGTILGRLSSKTSTKPRRGGPDAACSMSMAALNLAIVAQPMATDRLVFTLYYVHQVGSVKLAASVLGISRQHWYRLLRDFRRRVWAAAREIQAENERARDAMPHYDAAARQ